MAVQKSKASGKLPVALHPHELEARTWIQMVRTFSQIERRLEGALAKHALSLPQFDVLANLHAGEGITQQELAGRLLVTKGNVCGLLDRVEEAGWVSRRPDAQDRRANRLFLTKSGRQMLKSVGPEHQAILKDVLSVLLPGEVQSLFQLLDRLEQRTQETPG